MNVATTLKHLSNNILFCFTPTCLKSLKVHYKSQIKFSKIARPHDLFSMIVIIYMNSLVRSVQIHLVMYMYVWQWICYCLEIVVFPYRVLIIFSPLPVVLCIILVAGFWLAVINSLPVVDQDDYRDTVRFGYAFYIYLSSGVFTLVGTCLNLLLAKTAAERRRQYRNNFR